MRYRCQQGAELPPARRRRFRFEIENYWRFCWAEPEPEPEPEPRAGAAIAACPAATDAPPSGGLVSNCPGCQTASSACKNPSHTRLLDSNEGVEAMFAPVFGWIDAATANGHNVLIHCLAGAHRERPTPDCRFCTSSCSALTSVQAKLQADGCCRCGSGAGTTGIAFLMHACEMDVRQALTEAKRCRPCIDPLGGFAGLLVRLDESYRAKRKT